MKTLPWIVLLSALLAGCCCPPDGTTARSCAAVEPPPVAAPPQPAQPEEVRVVELTPDAKVRLTLSKKRVKGLSWEEVNLDQAITYLRTISGFNFYISPKVREEKFEDVVISAELDDVSLATILSAVLTAPYELDWEVREQVGWILSNEEVEGQRFLRYYDVKDLANHDAAEKTHYDSAPLEDEIRREVHPRYWLQEGATMEGRNGILIVRASRPVLKAIDRYLQAERAALRKPELPAALKAKIDATKVNLSVKEQSLSDVIKVLQIQTGFNLMIDPRVANDVKDNPISALELRDAPLMTAMTMLAASAGEGYVWTGKGHVAILTHREYAGWTATVDK